MCKESFIIQELNNLSYYYDYFCLLNFYFVYRVCLSGVCITTPQGNNRLLQGQYNFYFTTTNG